MPIIRSVKKDLRKTKKRTKKNKDQKRRLKLALKKTKKDAKGISELYSLIDKAAKNRVVSKNKAARLKRRTAKPTQIK